MQQFCCSRPAVSARMGLCACFRGNTTHNNSSKPHSAAAAPQHNGSAAVGSTATPLDRISLESFASANLFASAQSFLSTSNMTGTTTRTATGTAAAAPGACMPTSILRAQTLSTSCRLCRRWRRGPESGRDGWAAGRSQGGAHRAATAGGCTAGWLRCHPKMPTLHALQ